MNQLLKKAFILFILLSSANLFAQEDIISEDQQKPFKPKFTLGSGLYTLTGDIQNKEVGFIKGKSGFNAGMKFELASNIDLSFLFLKTAFSGDNGDEQFYSDVDGFGFHLGYTIDKLFKQSRISPTFSIGFQNLGFSTTNTGEKQDRSRTLSVPIGFGLRMDVTERLQFDIVMNFGMGMSDIDMSKINEDNADGYKSLNFVIHYDLFSPSKNNNSNYFDDGYYADVDFAKLESEDEDGDLVLDMDDYCPKTPIGVKVDGNGCPLDEDKDGIANYLDKQKNTPNGSIVDENGVQLTSDQYYSMYSDSKAASRKYANFYNEVEIKRENYKTVDQYLIAKANAFNKAYNESINDASKVSELKFKVKIGEFKDVIPARITNKLLSMDDLESYVMDDDAVIYTVGSYSALDEAISRLFAVEDNGFDDTYIIVDDNGKISEYIEPNKENKIDNEEVVIAYDYEVDSNVVLDSIVKEDETINETTYRIQIGAFNQSLSAEVFVGVNNVISFTGKDGLVRYMAGSFINYKDAIDYQAQMKARGFDDSFIVTYKNGERISLNVAIKTNNTTPLFKMDEFNEVPINLKFIIQIMVAEALVSYDDLEKMSRLGNIDKMAKGSDMYEYYAGTYTDLEEANIQLKKAKLEGFTDAFIFATKDGERIPIELAKELLKK